MPQGNYNVRNTEVEEKLREVGRTLKTMMPEGWGFTFLMFDFATNGDPGSLFYLSSANRDDMVKAMKEFIKRNEH